MSGGLPFAEPPSQRELRPHLLGRHHMPAELLDDHQVSEHVLWHDAEHRTREPGKAKNRHPGHVSHTHTKPKKETP